MTIIILSMICLTVVGQERTYVIQRGETLQSIAKKFGVYEFHIENCNWNVKEFRAGMTINLPAHAKELTPDEIFENDMAKKKLDEAKQYLADGKTKKALKSLKKSLGYKWTDDAGYLTGKLYYEDMDYKKAEKYFRLAQDNTTLPLDQQYDMHEKLAVISRYNEQKRANRAARWQNFGQALAQGLQTTVQQMQAANANNMYNQNMYGGVPNYGGYWNTPNTGVSNEVYKIYADAMSDQMKMESIRSSGQQLMQQTYNQVMSTYKAPSWDDLDKEYEAYVEYYKAQGWYYMDKNAYMKLKTENMAAQTAATQEYINEQKKINEDQRAFRRDMSRREIKSRVNHIKMQNDLKTGTYTGSSSYTTSSYGASTASTRTTYTPSHYSFNTTTHTTNTASSYTTGYSDEKEDPTHREQYRNKKVYESDYRDTKQKVTLYRRDGDKAYPDYHQMTVYEKGGTKYIMIGNMYYPIENCNWNGYKHYIHYKFRLYLNL